MSKNGQNWIETDQNRPKYIKMDKKLIKNQSKRIKMSQNESKWI